MMGSIPNRGEDNSQHFRGIPHVSSSDWDDRAVRLWDRQMSRGKCSILALDLCNGWHELFYQFESGLAVPKVPAIKVSIALFLFEGTTRGLRQFGGISLCLLNLLNQLFIGHCWFAT